MGLGFSAEEFSLLSNQDILITKRRIQKKIYTLLVSTHRQLNAVVNLHKSSLPREIISSTGKISKGENYLHLPYLILDYPAYFTKTDIFAFRTMFYWGNFFSATLHLQGSYLKKYRHNLHDNWSVLEKSGIYISCGETPWHYYYKPDNYVMLNQENKDKILTDPFVKLSTKIDLADWRNLPVLSTNYLTSLIKMIDH